MSDGVQEMVTEGIYQKRAAQIWLMHNVNKHRRDLGLPSVAQERTQELMRSLKAFGQAAQEARLAIDRVNRFSAATHWPYGSQIADSE